MNDRPMKIIGNRGPATAEDIELWQCRMRAVVLETITRDEIREVLHALLTKAKEGNLAAAKLVLSYAVGSAVESAISDPVTSAEPGSEDKIEILARRHAKGLPLHRNGDGPNRSLD